MLNSLWRFFFKLFLELFLELGEIDRVHSIGRVSILWLLLKGDCKVIHVSTYKPSTYKPTVSIDKDRPAQNKESGTRKERTAC